MNIFKYPILYFILSIFSFSSQSIRFIVPDFKPYTYREDGEFKGIGIEKIENIMKKLDIDYTIKLAPNYGRAVKEIIENRADVFLLASRNTERDDFAVFSKPLLINKWVWFFKNSKVYTKEDITPDTNLKIGTHINANTHKWLIKNKYNVVSTPYNTEVLPILLWEERIDAVFLAEEVFNSAVIEKKMLKYNFNKIIQSEKPFGIYISKKYIEEHPDFMKKLNNAIEQLIADN